MQTASATYSRLINGKCDYEAKLVIDDVGEFGEDQLFSIRTSVALFSGSPKVGTAASQEIDITMMMPTVALPRMACLRPYIRARGTAAKSSAVTITGGNPFGDLFAQLVYDSETAGATANQLAQSLPSSGAVDETLSSAYVSVANETATFSAQSGATVSGETLSFPVDATEELVSEWIPQGVYYVDTRQVSANYNGIPTLTLHGYDAMLKAEQEYASNETVGNAKDKAYVQSIADSIGVEVDPRTWEVMGNGRTIPMPLGYTMREILGYIASAYVGCFVMTDEGKLRLISLLGLPEYEDTSLLCTEDRYVLLFGEDAILV